MEGAPEVGRCKGELVDEEGDDVCGCCCCRPPLGSSLGGSWFVDGANGVGDTKVEESEKRGKDSLIFNQNRGRPRFCFSVWGAWQVLCGVCG